MNNTGITQVRNTGNITLPGGRTAGVNRVFGSIAVVAIVIYAMVGFSLMREITTCVTYFSGEVNCGKSPYIPETTNAILATALFSTMALIAVAYWHTKNMTRPARVIVGILIPLGMATLLIWSVWQPS